jgi:hypothetical protein
MKNCLRARVRARAGARFIFNLFRFLSHLSAHGGHTSFGEGYYGE